MKQQQHVPKGRIESVDISFMGEPNGLCEQNVPKDNTIGAKKVEGSSHDAKREGMRVSEAELG